MLRLKIEFPQVVGCVVLSKDVISNKSKLQCQATEIPQPRVFCFAGKIRGIALLYVITTIDFLTPHNRCPKSSKAMYIAEESLANFVEDPWPALELGEQIAISA